jgi:hypothetical protein
MVAARQVVYDRQPFAHCHVDLLGNPTLQGASGDVRMVGHHHEREPGVFEFNQRVHHSGQYFKLRHRLRRVRDILTYERSIEGTVSIEKHCRSQNATQTTDSHFVAAAFSNGCDTSRCQITACIDSACGVMWAALTVGTSTYASATVAV